MIRIISLAIVSLLTVPPACIAQDTAVAEPSLGSDAAAKLAVENGERSDRKDEVKNDSDFMVLTFILLMFTNAVICGHWAINTGRNFWGWYLFGLFTGPLAGGCMLHHSAREQSGEMNPGGGWAAIAGIGIPLAGWLLWLVILK